MKKVMSGIIVMAIVLAMATTAFAVGVRENDLLKWCMDLEDRGAEFRVYHSADGTSYVRVYDDPHWNMGIFTVTYYFTEYGDICERSYTFDNGMVVTVR